MNKRAYVIIMIAFVVSLVMFAGCLGLFPSSSDEGAEDITEVGGMDADTEQLLPEGDVSAQTASMPPSDMEAEPQAHKEGEVAYEGEVVITKFLGRAELKGIKSKYSCQTDEDCTSTKFVNIPTGKQDCKCQAPCTPYVVNKQEEKLRREANESFCGPSDWFGLTCPAPECRFYAFAFFKCVENICYGAAGAPRADQPTP